MADVVQQPVLKALSGMLTSGQEFAPELLESLLTNNPQQTAVQTPPQGETLSQQIRRLSQKFSGGARAGIGGTVGGLLGNPDIGKTNQQVLASRIKEAGGLFSDATNQEIRPELIEEIKSLGTPEQISAVTQLYSTLAEDKAKKQVLIQELQRQIGTDDPQYLDLVNQIRAGNLKTVASIREAVKRTPLKTKNTLLEYVQQNYSDQLEDSNVLQLIKLIKSRNLTKFSQLSDALQKLNIPDKYQIQQSNLLKKRVEERHTDKNGVLTETGRTLMESIDAQDVKTLTALFNLEQKLGFEKLSDKEANLIQVI